MKEKNELKKILREQDPNTRRQGTDGDFLLPRIRSYLAGGFFPARQGTLLHSIVVQIFPFTLECAIVVCTLC